MRGDEEEERESGFTGERRKKRLRAGGEGLVSARKRKMEEE